MEDIMFEYATKYFGNISLNAENKDVHNNHEINVNFNEKIINIKFSEFIVKDKNKLNFCFEMIDKYFELTEIVKNIITKNISEIWTGHFKYCPETGGYSGSTHNPPNNLTDIEIKNVVEKLDCPDILFDGGFFNEDSIEFSLHYEITNNYSKELISVISVILDKDLNFIHISYETAETG
jgi:hypothetical protein